ncbi:MAG: DUF302 domain-containing protein [Pseudomonadota bacterium]
MRSLIALLLMTTTAAAELVEVPTSKSVDAATEAFVAAVEGAGARVFAVVDHDGGAESIGTPIDDVHLVIFGNPRVGTSAMEISPLAGLALPLHVLIYETSEGEVRFAYEDPSKRLADLAGEPLPAAVTDPMMKALGGLTAKAAE